MATVVFVVLLVAAALILIRLGYGMAENRLVRQRAELVIQRIALDEEWRALDDTRRVRAVFLGARQAMHNEARRHGAR